MFRVSHFSPARLRVARVADTRPCAACPRRQVEDMPRLREQWARTPRKRAAVRALGGAKPHAAGSNGTALSPVHVKIRPVRSGEGQSFDAREQNVSDVSEKDGLRG